jgi:HD-like signal output (HDOD) protein
MIGHTPKKTIFELIADPRASQHLPSLSSVLRELEDLAGRNNVMIQEISRLIRSDQGLAVRILRLANSAFFAPTEPILDVDQALIYLGLSHVRTTIFTTRCIEQTCSVNSRLLPWKEFWLHEVGVGFITRLLAQHMREKPLTAESYYIMGLFHDIGKLVLAFLSPEDFNTVLTLADERNCETSVIEFELLGIDHATLGAWYLQQQGLPAMIFEPIRLHHAWKIEGHQSTLSCLVSLADKIAHFYKLGRSGSQVDVSGNLFEWEEWVQYQEHCGYTDAAEIEKHRNAIQDELGTIPDVIHQIVS